MSHPSRRPGDGDDNVAGIAALYEAFPDFFATVDELVIDVQAGTVTERWSATGTHRGALMGV